MTPRDSFDQRIREALGFGLPIRPPGDLQERVLSRVRRKRLSPAARIMAVAAIVLIALVIGRLSIRDQADQPVAQVNPMTLRNEELELVFRLPPVDPLAILDQRQNQTIRVLQEETK